MDLDVTKVANRLILRLFNHRQFTSGEIDYLINEICHPTEKSFPRVLTTNQNICLISDRSTDNCLEAANDILAKVSSLEERADRLIKSEEQWRQKEGNLLSDSRRQLEKSIQDRKEDITCRLKRLSESLANEESELEQSYLEFEKRHLQHS